MARIKFSQLTSFPKGKLVREAVNEHKSDTYIGRDVPKSKHILDLKHQAKSKALESKKGKHKEMIEDGLRHNFEPHRK